MKILPTFNYIQQPTKAYVLIHYTGNGVVEYLHEDKGIIAEGDSYYELKLFGDKLFQAFNTDVQIASTWTRHKFRVEHGVIVK